MTYKVSVDGEIIGSVEDTPGMTLIGSALELAGDKLNTNGFPSPENRLGEHGPKSVILTGTEVRITTCGQ